MITVQYVRVAIKKSLINQSENTRLVTEIPVLQMIYGIGNVQIVGITKDARRVDPAVEYNRLLTKYRTDSETNRAWADIVYGIAGSAQFLAQCQKRYTEEDIGVVMPALPGSLSDSDAETGNRGEVVTLEDPEPELGKPPRVDALQTAKPSNMSRSELIQKLASWGASFGPQDNKTNLLAALEGAAKARIELQAPLPPRELDVDGWVALADQMDGLKG